jgi:hypothetical protein
MPLRSLGQGAHLGVAFRSESGNINSSHVLASHTSVALNYGVYGISVDWPRTPNSQQPLNYRSMPRSADGIASGHHVYIARKAAPKASLCCSLDRSIPAALGRFTPKAKPERRLIGETFPIAPKVPSQRRVPQVSRFRDLGFPPEPTPNGGPQFADIITYHGYVYKSGCIGFPQAAARCYRLSRSARANSRRAVSFRRYHLHCPSFFASTSPAFVRIDM